MPHLNTHLIAGPKPEDTEPDTALSALVGAAVGILFIVAAAIGVALAHWAVSL
jgi:hypothetical protein